jgi:hypothetical protein
MLSEAKHLGLSSCYEAEILRLWLRMTLRYGLLCDSARLRDNRSALILAFSQGEKEQF